VRGIGPRGQPLRTHPSISDSPQRPPVAGVRGPATAGGSVTSEARRRLHTGETTAPCSSRKLQLYSVGRPVVPEGAVEAGRQGSVSPPGARVFAIDKQIVPSLRRPRRSPVRADGRGMDPTGDGCFAGWRFIVALSARIGLPFEPAHWPVSRTGLIVYAKDAALRGPILSAAAELPRAHVITSRNPVRSWRPKDSDALR